MQQTNPLWRYLLFTATTCGLIVAAAELPHWRASRQALRSAPTSEDAGPEAVLVLGYPARRDGRLHPMQRWRTDIAVRSMHPKHGRLVFSGAGRDGGPAEAEVMAAYARQTLAVPADRILLETRAQTTWQNVEYSAELLENAATIKVASSPMHAARARRYLARQRPDLADRLAAADDYRFGEQRALKLATVAHRLMSSMRARARHP